MIYVQTCLVYPGYMSLFALKSLKHVGVYSSTIIQRCAQLISVVLKVPVMQPKWELPDIIIIII